MSVKLPRGPAIRALLWEDWRRSRVVFFVSLGIGLLLHLTNWSIRWGTSGEDSVAVAVIVFFPLLFFGITSVFSLGDFRELNTRIPARHRTLPVHPIYGAALHLAFRVAAISLLSVVLIASGQWLGGRVWFDDYAGVIGLAIPLFLLLQCLAWSVGSFGVVTFLISLVVFPVGLIAFGRPLSVLITYIATEYSLLTLVALWVALQLLLAGIAIGASFLTRYRQSDIALRLTIPRLTFRQMPLEATGALHEQTWYEWTRNGYLLPLTTLVLTGFAVLLVGIGVAVENHSDDAQMLARIIAFGPIYASPAAAILAGLRGMMDDRHAAQSGLGAYVYSHPLSTRGFALARLQMALRSVLANQALCLVCYLAGMAAIVAFSEESNFATYLTADRITRFFLLGLGHTLLVWTMFWMAIPAIFFWFWYLVVMAAYDIFNIRDEGMLIPIIVVPSALLLMGLTIYVSVRMQLLRLLDVRLALRSGLIAIVALLFVLWYVPYISADLSFESLFQQVFILVGIVALSLCPALPILGQPLLVHRLRHR